jgi:hypothetical protein
MTPHIHAIFAVVRRSGLIGTVGPWQWYSASASSRQGDELQWEAAQQHARSLRQGAAGRKTERGGTSYLASATSRNPVCVSERSG